MANKTPLRIIANRRISLTDDEFNEYNRIVEAYSKNQMDGKVLFDDLFETDQEGLLIFLKAPKKMFSFEVVVFLQNVMINQHLRKIYTEHDDVLKELRQEIQELKTLKQELKNSNA